MEVKIINIPSGQNCIVLDENGDTIAKVDKNGDVTYPDYKAPSPTELKNKEGYNDPTAYKAIQNLDKEEDRKFRRLLRGLFNLCDLAGFEIQGRIVFKSRKTGRLWK